MLALLAVGCNNANKDDFNADLIRNPNSAQGYDNKMKTPEITFEKDMHDFGRLVSGESISFSFKFTNTGNGDLLIRDCNATCGCTVADFPHEVIKPGESGYVTVSFNSSGKVGQQYQEVTVISNAQPGRNKLKIRAQVS